ncbi:MAG: 3-deoxy-manno-octulosonate cytidylyltransferase [Pseudomonadota bacterium]
MRSPVFHAVIPARYAASRLPGKPLADLGGQPMINWVAAAAAASGAASVTIATDDERIATAARSAGWDARLTRPEHPSGSDRACEVADALGLADDDIVVNVQGDEPLIAPRVVAQVAELVARDVAPVASLAEPITTASELLDSAAVKVVVRADGRALYFSRAPIPFAREGGASAATADTPPLGLRHVGLYGYRCAALRQFVRMPPSRLERLEGLEQLRLLENGYDILIAPAVEPSPGGVDTPADLDRVRTEIEARALRPHDAQRVAGR